MPRGIPAKRRGRPPGSKNKTVKAALVKASRPRGRPKGSGKTVILGGKEVRAGRPKKVETAPKKRGRPAKVEAVKTRGRPRKASEPAQVSGIAELHVAVNRLYRLQRAAFLDQWRSFFLKSAGKPEDFMSVFSRTVSVLEITKEDLEADIRKLERETTEEPVEEPEFNGAVPDEASEEENALNVL